jgi:hypothetical protein
MEALGLTPVAGGDCSARASAPDASHAVDAVVAVAGETRHQLAVGTFDRERAFDAAGGRPRLRELGVTAIELMPVATFPGNRGWGYDGLYTWAPHLGDGGPEGFARLVAAPHAQGSASSSTSSLTTSAPETRPSAPSGRPPSSSTKRTGATRSTIRSGTSASRRLATHSYGSRITEVAEEHPSQLFSDHVDLLIGDATRGGRCREAARFAGFAAEAGELR